MSFAVNRVYEHNMENAVFCNDYCVYIIQKFHRSSLLLSIDAYYNSYLYQILLELPWTILEVSFDRFEVLVIPYEYDELRCTTTVYFTS